MSLNPQIRWRLKRFLDDALRFAADLLELEESSALVAMSARAAKQLHWSRQILAEVRKHVGSGMNDDVAAELALELVDACRLFLNELPIGQVVREDPLLQRFRKQFAAERELAGQDLAPPAADAGEQKRTGPESSSAIGEPPERS